MSTLTTQYEHEHRSAEKPKKRGKEKKKRCDFELSSTKMCATGVLGIIKYFYVAMKGREIRRSYFTSDLLVRISL